MASALRTPIRSLPPSASGSKTRWRQAACAACSSRHGVRETPTRLVAQSLGRAVTLALLVYICLVLAADVGIIAVAALVVLEAERKPSPAENARRYTQEDGTW